MSDTENGPPPAPKKKGLWSRLTGGWGSEAETPAPAAPEPDVPEGTEPATSDAPVGDVQAVPDLAADARPESDASAMGDAPAEEERAEESQAEEVAVAPPLAEHSLAEVPAAEASAPQEDPARTPLVPTAPVEEQPVPADAEETEASFAETSLAETPAAEAPEPAKTSFWRRLTSGLARTASSLTQGITDLVSKRKLDAETLEELEDILIRADLGTATAARIVEAVGRGRHDKMIGADEVKGLIAAEVESILAPVARPLVIDGAQKPFIILMVGVNGSGKTTTIG